MLISRRHVLHGAGALVAASALPLPAIAQARRPNLTIAVQALATTLEPVNAISNVGNRITNALFDTLIRRDFLANAEGSGTELKPGIAASWKREDARTVTVTIADGVKFHNGQSVTAADVAFTFSAERLWGPKPLVTRGPLFSAQFESVEALDGRTVRFRTRGPDYSVEKRLASWLSWIVPADYYRGLGPDAFGLKPIGTGPYRLVEFVTGDRVVLEPFDDYFLGRPTAGRITFQVVPEVATRVAGLISGEYEMACALMPDNVALVTRSKDVETRAAQIENVHLLVYNQANKWLADKRVRQALNLSIDRPLINKTLWGGMAGVTNGFQIPQFGAAYDAGRPAFEVNPERARALLKEAGYDGSPISYRTLNDYYVNSVGAGQMMQQMWRAAGLNVQLEILEQWTQVLGPGMAIRNWSNGFQMPDPATPLTSDWGPEGTAQQTMGWKPPAEYGELIKTVRELPDGPERRAAFQRLITVWDDEAPGAVLYRPAEIYGVRRNIQWRPVTFEMMDLRPNNLAFG